MKDLNMNLRFDPRIWIRHLNWDSTLIPELRIDTQTNARSSYPIWVVIYPKRYPTSTSNDRLETKTQPSTQDPITTLDLRSNLTPNLESDFRNKWDSISTLNLAFDFWTGIWNPTLCSIHNIPTCIWLTKFKSL